MRFIRQSASLFQKGKGTATVQVAVPAVCPNNPLLFLPNHAFTCFSRQASHSLTPRGCYGSVILLQKA